MAIEVGKKKKKGSKTPKGLDIFFQAMVILFIIIVGSYFFAQHLKSQAEETKTEIESEIERRKAEVPEKKEMEDAARYYSNLIRDFKTVSDNRHIISSFFSPLERSIHPEVTIVALNIDPEGKSAVIEGEGEDFIAVGQQFHALKNRDFIEDVALSSLSTVRDGEEIDYITFVFDIEIVEDLFTKTIKEDD